MFLKSKDEKCNSEVYPHYRVEVVCQSVEAMVLYCTS